MGTGVIEKIKKLNASRPQNNSNQRKSGIYHNWKDGANLIRLIGEFLEVKTHFIAPNTKRKDRGLCKAEAFQGEKKLPQVINCPDWDIEREEAKKVKTCPLCKLAALSRAMLKDNPTEEEKKFFESLKSASYARTNLKWNVLDRDDPFITIEENGAARKEIGFKISTIGMECWKDIEGIFGQVGFDITDPDTGVDIKVNKGSNGARTVYTAQLVMQGTSAKVTPLTPEERALVPYDLKNICGRQVDVQAVIDALHTDIRDVLTANDGGDDIPVDDEPVIEESEVSAPATKVTVVKTVDTPKAKVAEALAEDEDGVASVAQKKTT